LAGQKEAGKAWLDIKKGLTSTKHHKLAKLSQFTITTSAMVGIGRKETTSLTEARIENVGSENV